MGSEAAKGAPQNVWQIQGSLEPTEAPLKNIKKASNWLVTGNGWHPVENQSLWGTVPQLFIPLHPLVPF